MRLIPNGLRGKEYKDAKWAVKQEWYKKWNRGAPRKDYLYAMQNSYRNS